VHADLGFEVKVSTSQGFGLEKKMRATFESENDYSHVFDVAFCIFYVPKTLISLVIKGI